MQPYAYYSREDIKKFLVETSKNREVVAKYKDQFGNRPDIIQFEGDVLELVKKGATSFHISEEHWADPLNLKPGMTKSQLDNLRTGWDCLLDVDSEFLEYSKICAKLLVDALKFHDVKNIFCKFSGNKGFHIAVPFFSFPPKVNNIVTRLLFPEGVKTIASYLKQMIQPYLAEEILKKDNLDVIAKKTNKKETDLIKDNQFDPYVLVDIDTVLISNRHLFRAPYSLHEKSGLVSLPIKPEQILTFEKELASPENIKINIKFLNQEPKIKEDAKQLIIQAFDWQQKQEKIKIPKQKEFLTPKVPVQKEFFPPCIQEILSGIKEDGRKRSLFILINFLKSTGYEMDSIVSIITKWNQKNYNPLKEGYIQSQINWHRNQKTKILPPNCTNPAYYKDLSVCNSDNLCKLIKNPVNYTLRKMSFKKRKTKDL